MAEGIEKRRRRMVGIRTGLKTGLVGGVGFFIISWLAAGVLKGVITVFSGVWPEWFPGHIVDAVLSGWWVMLIIFLFAAAGALIGALFPRRYDLL